MAKDRPAVLSGSDGLPDCAACGSADGVCIKPRIVDERPFVVVILAVEFADRLLRAGAGHADDGAAAELLAGGKRRVRAKRACPARAAEGTPWLRATEAGLGSAES